MELWAGTQHKKMPESSSTKIDAEQQPEVVETLPVVKGSSAKAEDFNIFSTDINVTNYGALKQLKSLFPNEPDEVLARFIIARNYDVEKAAAQLEKHISWRSKAFPISKSANMKEISTGKAYIHGTDKDGHPLIVMNVKLFNARERDLNEQIQMSLWWLQVVTSPPFMPPNKSKFSLLVNRVDSGANNIDLESDKAVLSLFQDNFPERLHRAIVYPSNLLFVMVWNIIRFFIDRVTQEKVKLVMTLPGVQEFIDDEFIPVSMVLLFYSAA